MRLQELGKECERKEVGVEERRKGKGKRKEWKFHRRVGKAHLKTKHSADRNTKVIGEAEKEEGRTGWITMGPALK